MIFLALRIFPYLSVLVYFSLIRLMFVWPDFWNWFLLSVLVWGAVYFLLLKYKNPHKPIFISALFSFALLSAGAVYVLILGNGWLVNLFLVIWSALIGFYFEGVFHDFYKTERVGIINLDNLSLYAGMLAVFFFTATIVNLFIFLNFDYWLILLILTVVYGACIFKPLKRIKPDDSDLLIWGTVFWLILFEVLVALLFLPFSFYVIAFVVASVYYLLFALVLATDNKTKWRRLIYVLIVLLLIFVTANWF